MKTIPGFPDYAITKDGRVWSKPQKGKSKGQWLKATNTANGYFGVTLQKNTIRCHCPIHKLVLETYVGPRPGGKECRHLDGVKAHNHLDNLKWGTRSENQQDSVRHGVASCLRCGEKSNRAELTEQQVRQIVYIYRIKLFCLREIAEQFGKSMGCISNIIYRKTWKHLWNKEVA